LEEDYNAGRTHPDKTGRRATIIVLGERDASHMRNHHRVVAIALGTMLVPDGPDLHVTRNHRGTAAVPDMEAEVDDPDHHNEHMMIHAKEMPEPQSRKHRSKNLATSGMSTIMRTRKKQWEPLALPIGFAERKYPKDLSYLMTNRNMMDRKNLSHGYQIICRPFQYSGAPKQQQFKVYSYTLWGLLDHG
jgi:hypothetical protein